MAKDSQTIVVACDGSAQSLSAARTAAELAGATGHPLKLLSVYPDSKASVLAIAGVGRSEIEADKEKHGREVFDAAKEALDGSVDSAEEILLKGDPAREIIEYTRANPGAHLVLGRRGYSPLRSLTLGSVSEKVVRHATGPVTVVGE